MPRLGKDRWRAGFSWLVLTVRRRSVAAHDRVRAGMVDVVSCQDPFASLVQG